MTYAQSPGALYYYYQGQRKPLTPSSAELIVAVKPGESLPTLADMAPGIADVEATVTAIAPSVQRVTLRSAGAPAPPLSVGRTALRAPFQPRPGPASDAAAEEQRRLIAPQQRDVLATVRLVTLRAYADHPAVAYAYEGLVLGETGTVAYPTDRIIVKVSDGVTEADLRQRLPTNLRVHSAMMGPPGEYLVELIDPKRDHPVTLAAQLHERHQAWLEWAVPDFLQPWLPAYAPSDALYGNQWHIQNTGQGNGVPDADTRLYKAWDQQLGSSSIAIAIIDDGIQLDHPDFDGAVVNARANHCGKSGDTAGWDFFEQNADPSPVLGAPSHGTAVAGVAGARGNTLGGIGACPGCSLISVRVRQVNSFVADSTLAQAITYAACVADVLNNSWGGSGSSEAITAAVQSAAAGTGSPAPKRGGKGTPILFATGNDAAGWVSYTLLAPAAGPHTIEWRYVKAGGSNTAGFDTVWLDIVELPDGTIENFEADCTALPAGWTSTGSAPWRAVDQESRSSSVRGGKCSIKAGAIGAGQHSGVKKEVTANGTNNLRFRFWVSSAPEGPLVTEGYPRAHCVDGLMLLVDDVPHNFFSCGTYNNQNRPLQDGVISFPANLPQSIAVGASTNFDRRSEYSQWGDGIFVVAPSSGGTVGITTTDLIGVIGYSDGDPTNTNSFRDTSADPDYTNSFGGTSSSTPLVAGIVGLYLSQHPAATLGQVRTALRSATRKVGCIAYHADNNSHYGYGVVDAERLVTGSSTVADTPDTCQTVESDKPGTSAPSTGSGGGSSGACMLSYITQGWLPQHYLNPLRQFRGWVISQGAWGREAVRAYYHGSAQLIRFLNSPQLGAVALGM